MQKGHTRRRTFDLSFGNEQKMIRQKMGGDGEGILYRGDSLSKDTEVRESMLCSCSFVIYKGGIEADEAGQCD